MSRIPLMIALGVAVVLWVIWMISPRQEPPGLSPGPNPSIQPRQLAVDGNRLAYLDDFTNPYWPAAGASKLTTPQWIGEPGVEAVAVLSIDDMRDPAKYEAFLRPILQRLERWESGGETGMSIFTNVIEPNDARLQTFLQEGVSIEVHTIDHPCPLLYEGDFDKAKSTVHRCIDLLDGIPNASPRCYRMPCCDSMNSVSPRFFADIFTPQTEAGNHLTMDSSVFMRFTEDRFQKYVPLGKDFVNLIDDYPYPYVIGGNCWELPCMVPSDWEAQFLHGENNPVTVADLAAALDKTVAMQGVFTFVFHPHGWIENTQVVELIDHAESTHGKAIRFLSVKQIQERIDRNLLGGRSLRQADGTTAAIRILDLDHDGFMDVLLADGDALVTRVYQPKSNDWLESRNTTGPSIETAAFGIVQASGRASLLTANGGFWHFGEDNRWHEASEKAAALPQTGKRLLRDLDDDGVCEILVSSAEGTSVHTSEGIELPNLGLDFPLTAALRFLDLDEDGDLDVVHSDADSFAIHSFVSPSEDWNLVREGTREAATGAIPPPFTRADGTDNGVWVHRRTFVVQNEDTASEPNVIVKVKFDEILASPEEAENLLNSKPRDPEVSLSEMTTKPGLRIELAASEPMVMDPVDIAWGADGNLWVVEMADYPLGLDGEGKPGGRVRYLTDANGDGRYDKSTLFLDGLLFPTGVMAWREGALVIAAPDVFYAEDTDGDGSADRREVLFNGFGEGNQQHRVNGLRWGLDNWVYLANGDSGGSVRSTKTGQTLDLGSHDLRIRPETGEMEALTGRAQFGRNRDDAGNWFGCNNSHTIWHYVLEDRYLKRNPHMTPPNPLVYIAEKRGNAPVYPTSVLFTRFNDFHTANCITSACGTNFYRDTWLGEVFAGNAFTCEPVHNLVHRQVLEPKGSTFISRRASDERESEFLTSRDPWFRPVSVHTGPDGALWIVDMYRLVIEHPEWIPEEWQEQLDLRSGQDRGRLYRVVKEGAEPRPFPNLRRMPLAEVIDQLAHPSGTMRDLAHREVIERGVAEDDRVVWAKLREIARDHERWEARVHALCVLDGLGKADDSTVMAAMKDEYPVVRRHAVRLLPGVVGSAMAVAVRAELQALIENETDAQIMLQLGITLGELGDLSLASGLLQRSDPYLHAAIISSATTDLDGLMAALESFENMNPDTAVPFWKNLVRTLIGEERFDLLERVEGRLMGLAADSPLQAWQLEVLNEIAGCGLSGAHWRQLRERLEPAVDKAKRLVDDESAPMEERSVALEFLCRVEPEMADERLVPAVAADQTIQWQRHALVLLAEHVPDRFVQFVGSRWEGFEPALRECAAGVLSSRVDLSKRFLQRYDGKPGDLAPGLLRIFEHHPDAAIREKVRGAGDDEESRSEVDETVRTRYRKALEETGDPEKGREHFETHCALCHQIHDSGQPIGPDLLTLSDRSSEVLLTAILEPNRAVEDKYLAYFVTRDDDSVTIGLLEGEAGDAILVRLVNGQTETLPRNRIKAIQSTGRSLMPEGLAEALGPEGVRDLVVFLQNARPPVD